VESTPVQHLIRAYEGSRRRRGYAASSAHRNGHYLRDFAQWAGDQEPGQITAPQIELGFIAEWCDQFEQRNGRAPKPRTVRNLIGQLRVLYAFADKFDLLLDTDGRPARNPMTKIDPPKVKRQIKEWLTPDEYERLLAAANTDDERFLIAWLGMTAMRISEAGSVTWRDVDMASHPGSILIRESKTDGGVRRITMISELRAHLHLRLVRQRERGLADPDCPVLCTKNRNGIQEQQANRTIKRVAKRAGIAKTVSCHALRRSWAMGTRSR
jgi:integrase